MKRMIVIPVLLGLFWTLLLLTLFIWNIAGERRHILELAEYQARAFFQQVVATRSWNSAHGGVFVPVGPCAMPNIHLPQGERVLQTAGGDTLARINPAYMTRQIAEIAAQSVGIHFHITSLTPIRPENVADAWERETLAALHPGTDRFELVPGAPGNDRFRFMAPLVTEESCRGCHPNDTLGSIRGGISVSAPAGPLLASRDRNQRTLATAYGIIWFVGLLGIGGSTFEITRRREKAEALSRMRSRFLANMSHDMRTPLTGILGLSERMLREALSPKATRYARLITHSAGSLLEIVGDILDFARLDSGRLELQAWPFDTRQAVDQTSRIFAFAAEDKGLGFTSEVLDTVPECLLGDAFRYRQVLANLLGNAVKFTERGSVRLVVDAVPGSQGLVLLRSVVIDTGVGIAPQNQARIFECFSQVDDSLSRCHAGSGLGLSIARQLARMMGGDISLESAPGQGSTFTFTAVLAVAPAEPAQPDASPKRDAAAGAKSALAGLRILVVDDHNANRILINDILREDGADVRLAASGRDALEVFRRSPFDLILLDLQMPGMDGIEVTHRLRALETELGRCRTPILILTAFALPEDANLLPAGEIAGVVTKPIDVAVLNRAILDATKAQRDTATVEGTNDDVLLETEEALRLLGGRQDLYRLLATEFLDSAPGLAEDFEAAVRRGDRQEAARLVHTIKSGAASLGAVQLRKKAAQLEIQSRNPSGVAPHDCRMLRDILNRTNQAIRCATPSA